MREPTLSAVGFLLFAHACIPGKPWGTFAARGRTDPRGDWSMPAFPYALAWLFLLASHAWVVYVKLASPDGPPLAAALELAALPFALFARTRPPAWLLLAAVALFDGELGLLLLHGFTFDPAWLAPRRDASPATLFYDGACGLCHRAVRFVLAEDRDGRGFRFAPLASEAFLQEVPASLRDALPDSLVLVTPDGQVRVRSAALIETGRRLGGLWLLLAGLSRALPQTALDRAYDAIAAVRHRLFQRPVEACPLLPADLRARFD